MEIKTAEEILDHYAGYYFEDIRPEHQLSTDALHEDILKSMREYAHQAVRLALEEVIRNNPTGHDRNGEGYVDTFIDADSILSLADSIIGKLK